MASEQSAKPVSQFLTITWTGLLAGTLDGLGATINFLIQGNKDPGKIFQYIASALYGDEAYAGGNRMVLTGILLHYLVAFLFTIFFFLLSRRMEWLRDNRLAGAVLYGIFMWLVMTFLVPPLTKIPPGTVRLLPALVGISILIIAIGIPLSFIASAYYKKYSMR